MRCELVLNLSKLSFLMGGTKKAREKYPKNPKRPFLSPSKGACRRRGRDAKEGEDVEAAQGQCPL
jgi:hypothetical protein